METVAFLLQRDDVVDVACEHHDAVDADASGAADDTDDAEGQAAPEPRPEDYTVYAEARSTLRGNNTIGNYCLMC